MFRQFMDIIVIFLIALAAITYSLRLINLFFRPAIFSRFRSFLESPPTRLQLALMYLLVVGCCVYAIKQKLAGLL